MSIRVGDPQVVVSGWVDAQQRVRCDELGPIPPCLPISVSIGRSISERHRPPLANRVQWWEILWYLLVRSVGTNQSVAASALASGPNKAAFVLILGSFDAPHQVTLQRLVQGARSVSSRQPGHGCWRMTGTTLLLCRFFTATRGYFGMVAAASGGSRVVVYLVPAHTRRPFSPGGRTLTCRG